MTRTNNSSKNGRGKNVAITTMRMFMATYSHTSNAHKAVAGFAVIRCKGDFVHANIRQWIHRQVREEFRWKSRPSRHIYLNGSNQSTISFQAS